MTHQRMYEAPETEVFAVRIDRNFLGTGVMSSRKSYGTANDGVSGVDEQGNWNWD